MQTMVAVIILVSFILVLFILSIAMIFRLYLFFKKILLKFNGYCGGLYYDSFLKNKIFF